MIGRLVLRHLALRPVRSAVFVGAYAAGVSVMLALLSIGEVMVEQARDEEWVGGGDVTVLPQGVDLETLRMGGAIFFGIEQSRFVAREVIAGPRLASQVEAVAPWIDDRAIYIRPNASGGEGAAGEAGAALLTVRASAQIPTAARALEAEPDLLSGAWEDSEADRRWLRPSPAQLYSEIDRFHLPPAGVRGDSTWAEWHYFNLLWPEQESWLYLTYMIGGDVGGERRGGGGRMLARYRSPDGRDLVFADTLGPERITFSETSPELRLGPNSVRLRADPLLYEVLARIPPIDGDAAAPLEVELAIAPEPHRLFPPVELAASDSLLSGYVVAALRARATGSVCVGERCIAADGAIAYHDHNWGTWGGVVWDWGIAHAGDLDVLYGGVHGSAAEAARRRGIPFLVYVVDSLGVAAVLGLDELVYSGARPVEIGGQRVDVPETLSWTAARGPDSLSALIRIERSSLTKLSVSGEDELYFAQMYGTLSLAGVIGGRSVNVSGPGFFETYLR